MLQAKSCGVERCNNHDRNNVVISNSHQAIPVKDRTNNMLLHALDNNHDNNNIHLWLNDPDPVDNNPSRNSSQNAHQGCALQGQDPMLLEAEDPSF